MACASHEPAEEARQQGNGNSQCDASSTKDFMKCKCHLARVSRPLACKLVPALVGLAKGRIQRPAVILKVQVKKAPQRRKWLTNHKKKHRLPLKGIHQKACRSEAIITAPAFNR